MAGTLIFRGKFPIQIPGPVIGGRRLRMGFWPDPLVGVESSPES